MNEKEMGVGKVRRGAWRRLKWRVQRGVPLLVWLGVLVVVGMLLQRQVPVLPARGVAEPARREVAATEAGQLGALAVREHQWVSAGAVLASLDDEGLLVRLRQARSELGRIAAERELVMARRQVSETERTFEVEDAARDDAARRRRFQRDLDESHLTLLRTQAELEEDRILLESLDTDVARLEGLIDEGVTSEAQYERLQASANALREKISRTEAVYARLEGEMRDAQERIAIYEDESAVLDGVPEDVEMAPWKYALEVQQAELDVISIHRSRLQVRAPVAGRVEVVHVHEGQTLGIGQVLFTLVEDRVASYVAYAPALSSAAIEVGQRVLVRRESAPHIEEETTVASIGPAYREKPAQLWARVDEPEWGLPVHLTPTNPPFAAPGESFSVQFATDEVN